MKTARHLIVAVAVLAFVGPVAYVYAQQSATARGQLVSVDTSAQMLTIQTADNQHMTFKYTPETKVTGSDEKVAGLATMNGAEITVHFRTEQQDKIATQIDVHARG